MTVSNQVLPSWRWQAIRESVRSHPYCGIETATRSCRPDLPRQRRRRRLPIPAHSAHRRVRGSERRRLCRAPALAHRVERLTTDLRVACWRKDVGRRPLTGQGRQDAQSVPASGRKRAHRWGLRGGWSYGRAARGAVPAGSRGSGRGRRPSADARCGLQTGEGIFSAYWMRSGRARHGRHECVGPPDRHRGIAGAVGPRDHRNEEDLRPAVDAARRQSDVQGRVLTLPLRACATCPANRPLFCARAGRGRRRSG